MALNVIYKNRNGTTQEWTASTYILLKGEMGIDTTLNIAKIGDGEHSWNDLPTLTGDLSNYVTLDTTQTITGTKTFSKYTSFNAGAEITGNEYIRGGLTVSKDAASGAEATGGGRVKILDSGVVQSTQNTGNLWNQTELSYQALIFSTSDYPFFTPGNNYDKTLRIKPNLPSKAESDNTQDLTLNIPFKEGTLATLDDIPTNIENGTATASIHQVADPKYNGIIKAATKNPYAKVLDASLTDSEPIGAIAAYSTSLGGNSSVQAKRGIGGGTSSVTKGAYSQSLGDNTVTTTKATDSTAIGYQTTTDAPAAFTHGSYTVVLGQKYVEGMFDPSGGGSSGGGSGQPTEPSTTPTDTLAMDTRRGEAASAGGFNSYASGFAASVDGVSNVADGHISKSSGRSNRSWSYLSKTDGYQSVVKPDEADTDATGEGSYANGKDIQIVGAKYAYAGGENGRVIKDASYSFSQGLGLVVSAQSQAVFGKYNTSSSDALLLVGCGTSDTGRDTAFQVTFDGRAKVKTAPTQDNDVVRKLELDAQTIKIDGNTSEITNLWNVVRDTNTSLNNVNADVQNLKNSIDTAPTKVKDTFVSSSWATSSATADTQFGKYYKDVTIPNKNIINVRCVSTKGMSGITLDYAPEIKCNNRRTSDTNLRIYSNSQLEGAVVITLVGDALPNKFSKTNATLSASSWTTSSATVDTQFAKYYTDITVPVGDVMNIRILSNEDVTGISTAAYYPEVWSDNRKINSTTLRVYSNKQVAGSATILTMEV